MEHTQTCLEFRKKSLNLRKNPITSKSNPFHLGQGLKKTCLVAIPTDKHPYPFDSSICNLKMGFFSLVLVQQLVFPKITTFDSSDQPLSPSSGTDQPFLVPSMLVWDLHLLFILLFVFNIPFFFKVLDLVWNFDWVFVFMVAKDTSFSLFCLWRLCFQGFSWNSSGFHPSTTTTHWLCLAITENVLFLPLFVFVCSFLGFSIFSNNSSHVHDSF